MDFFEHLDELEKTVGGGLTKITGSKFSNMSVWVRPSGLIDRSDYLNLINGGNSTLGSMECLFKRAHDENGKLLFDTPAKRERALESRAMSAMLELSQLIMAHDNKVAQKAAGSYKGARKNSTAQPESGSTN